MTSAPDPLPAVSFTRRRFLQATALPPFAVRASGADAPARLKAAVIGHTGQGDYGHGLDGIFQGRPNVELVALADPDPDGRARTAAKIQTPRTYADYRELLNMMVMAVCHAALGARRVPFPLNARTHPLAVLPLN